MEIKKKICLSKELQNVLAEIVQLLHQLTEVKGQNFELVQKVAFYQDQVRGFFKLQSECAALFASPPANALNIEKESRK